MAAIWIDFKELRRKLDFAKVLRHYGVELKPKAQGRRHQGFCPLPMHKGQRRSPSFSADLKRGIWKCFGACQEGGDILRFAALMEGLDPDRGEDIREAAMKLMDALGIDCDSPPASGNCRNRRVKHRDNEDAEIEDSAEAEKNAGQAATCPAIVNAPLNFQLQGLDPSHPYLKERGFTEKTVAYFGLGYCSRGLMQGRIAIPLHDGHGQLVGYAGRLVDDSLIDDENPKYLFPSVREREGKRYEFWKSLLVYNAHRIEAPVDELVVVEGFPATFWVWQAGFESTVALMGASCSQEQGEIIAGLVKPDGKVWLMPDGNEAGCQCALSAFKAIGPYRFVRWIKLGKNEQPTDCSSQDLQRILRV